MSSLASWRHWVVGATLLIAFSCGITPVPEPPPAEPPVLAPPQVQSLMVVVDSAGGSVAITAAPRAVHTKQTIWVANLETADPAIETEVQADGGFRTTLSAKPGDELRMQVRNSSGRSRPLDIVVPTSNGLPQVATRLLANCLTAEPEFELVFPKAVDPLATLTLTNHCGGEVRIASSRIRIPKPAFSVQTAAPVVIADGASGQLRLQFSGLEAEENLLLLDIQSPQVQRLPIQLFADTPPSCQELAGVCVDQEDAGAAAGCYSLWRVPSNASCAGGQECCITPSDSAKCEEAGGECMVDLNYAGGEAECDDKVYKQVLVVCPNTNQACCKVRYRVKCAEVGGECISDFNVSYWQICTSRQLREVRAGCADWYSELCCVADEKSACEAHGGSCVPPMLDAGAGDPCSLMEATRSTDSCADASKICCVPKQY